MNGQVDLTNNPKFVENTSGRFESRFSSVYIEKSPSIFFKDMEGSSLGIWIAHGEGKIEFPNDKTLDYYIKEQLVPLRYVNDNASLQTYAYPTRGTLASSLKRKKHLRSIYSIMVNFT